MATFAEVTDPYITSFRPVPPAGPGVCRICHWASGSYPQCYSCHQSTSQVTQPCPFVVPVSLCESLGPLHTLLRGYKDSPSQQVRERFGPRVAGVLGRFLALHGDCIARAAGQPWDVVVTVPSGHGRSGPHPLEDVVRLLVPLRDQLVPSLAAGPDPIEHNRARDDGFRVIRDVAGERILLIDDVMTSGSALQSAASALHAAAAAVVAAVPIGRYVKPDFNEHARAMWDAVSPAAFSFDTCCLE